MDSFEQEHCTFEKDSILFPSSEISRGGRLSLKEMVYTQSASQSSYFLK